MSFIVINNPRSTKTGDEILRVCRGCLATGCILYDLREKRLERAFGDLSGLSVCGGLVCGICLHLLRKFRAFRKRCTDTGRILGTMHPVTESVLSLVDRKHLQLQLNLIKTDTEIVNCDPNYKERSVSVEHLVKTTTLHINIPTIDDIRMDTTNDIRMDTNVKIEIERDNYYSDSAFDFDNDIKREHDDTITVEDDNDISDVEMNDLQKRKLKKKVNNKNKQKLSNIKNPAANQSTYYDNNELMIPRGSVQHIDIKNDNTLDVMDDTLKDSEHSDNDERQTIKQSIDNESNEEINTTLEPTKSKKNDDQALIKEMSHVFRRLWHMNKNNVYAMFERIHKESLAFKNGEKLSGKDLNVGAFWERSATYNFLELNKQLSDIYNVDIDFVSMDEMRREMDEKRSSGEYEQGCNLCCKKYNYSETYDRHMRRNHDSSLPMECEICQYRFKFQRQLVGHLLSAHARRIKCRVCGISSDYWNNAKGHSEYHRGVAQTCQFCGKKFTVKKLYLMHLRGKHRSEMPTVECLLCGDSFNGKDGLKVHTHWIHKEAVQCHSCAVWFLNAETLAAHLPTDGGCRPGHSSCPLCGATFTTEDLMKEHYKQQHSEYECKHCLIMFRTVKSYKLHKRRGTCGMRIRDEEKKERQARERKPKDGNKEDLQLVCEFCGKNFKHKALLKVHHRTHTGEKPYQCDQCQKKFATLTSLKTHVKIHSEERPYSCAQCHKTFRQPGHLQAHQVSHTKEKAHECNVCHKRFTQRGNMLEHVRTLHEGLPPKTRSRRRAKKQDSALVSE